VAKSPRKQFLASIKAYRKFLLSSKSVFKVTTNAYSFIMKRILRAYTLFAYRILSFAYKIMFSGSPGNSLKKPVITKEKSVIQRKT